MIDAFGPELAATAAELWGLGGPSAAEDLSLEPVSPPASERLEPRAEVDEVPSASDDLAQ